MTLDERDKDLMRFISGYESPESPQSVDEIRGDFQLAGLMTALNTAIASRPTSCIIDIGCGNGVLFAKLSETGCFQRYPSLIYKGFDFEPWPPRAFENATKLNLLPIVRLLPLDSNWIAHMKEPCIVVIRNVLHELSLLEVGDLLYKLATNLPNNSAFFLQISVDSASCRKGQMWMVWISHRKCLARVWYDHSSHT